MLTNPSPILSSHRAREISKAFYSGHLTLTGDPWREVYYCASFFYVSSFGRRDFLRDSSRYRCPLYRRYTPQGHDHSLYDLPSRTLREISLASQYIISSGVDRYFAFVVPAPRHFMRRARGRRPESPLVRLILSRGSSADNI